MRALNNVGLEISGSNKDERQKELLVELDLRKRPSTSYPISIGITFAASPCHLLKGECLANPVKIGLRRKQRRSIRSRTPI